MPGHGLVLISFVGVLLAVAVGCDSTEAGTDGVPGENLIENSSFEREGQPTLAGWHAANPSLATLVNEAPPHGGAWSLRLVADWIPTSGFVTSLVPEARDGDILRLSAWVRALSSDGGGVIGLVVGGSSRAKTSKWAVSADTVWTRLSVVDTLSIGKADSVWVVLSSPGTEVIARMGLFDLVTLEHVEK